MNPVVVAAMREKGFDLAGSLTKGVAGMIEAKRAFDYVITVCDETSAERCPRFPGKAARLHWGFPDPSAFTGTPEEKLALTRTVRDAIEDKIRTWCASGVAPARG
jgi:arsenate reductase